MKHTLILEQVQKSLIEDKSVAGLLLMGSVAGGYATSNSDLDLLVLSDHNEFKKEIREGIIVEYIYLTLDKAKEKLEKSKMEVYHYLDSQVLYDNGSINELIDIAKKKYASYITPKEEKQGISNWIFSTRLN